MNTNNNNNNTVKAEAEPTDERLADAAGKLAKREVTEFWSILKLATALAEADAASKLAESARAAYVSGLKFGTVRGKAVTMSGATYSKRVKVGRMATADYVPTPVEADREAKAKAKAEADGVDHEPTLWGTWAEVFYARTDRPSLDKMYEWLPKDAAMSKPRASKADKADDEAEADEADDAVKVKVAPIEVIFGLLPHCTAADLDRLGAEIQRLRTPVASVKAA